MTRPWEDYWSNPRGLSPAISAIWADRFCDHYLRHFPADPNGVILDYGAGFGQVAERLVVHFGQVLVWDPSPAMQEHLKRRSKNHANLHVVEDLAAVSEPPHTCIINSVLQYVDAAGLAQIAGDLTQLLPQSLVLSDIVPPHYSRARDAWQLLGDARRHGYLKAYLAHVLRELRHNLLWHIGAQLHAHALETLKAEFLCHGWKLERVVNFTPSRLRCTLLGERSGP